jgi:hypothetical protein
LDCSRPTSISSHVRLMQHVMEREEYFCIAQTSILHRALEITTCILEEASKPEFACRKCMCPIGLSLIGDEDDVVIVRGS